MTDIQSKEVIDKISDELKIQPAMKIPREIMDKIQLIFNVNPNRKARMVSAAANDSAAVNIRTTDATKRTFVIGGLLTVSKSVLSTSITSNITIQPIGLAAAQRFMTLNYEPVTAGEHVAILMLPEPIEVEPNSLFRVTNSTAIASIDTLAIVYFYETDRQ